MQTGLASSHRHLLYCVYEDLYTYAGEHDVSGVIKRTNEEQMSERVPLATSKAWIDRVDDWSFANRIRSRSEAIRRLVELGLNSGAQSND